MQALQVLQAAQSAQAAATSMGLGVAPPPPPASLSVQAYLPGPLKACMGGAPEEDLEGNAGVRTLAQEDILHCSLFLFVYKAELAMTEQAYVTITVGPEGDGVIFEGPVPKNGTADSTPCWEWHLQVPLELTFAQTTISFKVWGKRLLGDVLMGRQTMTFSRDSFSTVRGPVRETARLRIPVTQPMGIYVMPSCSGPANAEGIGGTLFFSYELTVNSQMRAPLSDVARLGGSNPEKDISRLWTIDMKTHGALMNRPTSDPVEVRFKLLLPSVPLAKDGVVDKNTYTPIMQKVGPVSLNAGGDTKWGTYDFTKCADDPALKVHCTEAALMGYVVLVSVHRVPTKAAVPKGDVGTPLSLARSAASAARRVTKGGFLVAAKKTMEAVADVAGDMVGNDDEEDKPEVTTQLGSRVVKLADFLRELLKSGTSVCLDFAMTQGATKTPVGLVRIECDIFHDYARPQCKAPDPATLAQNKDKLLKADGRCMSRHVLDEAEVQLCDGIGEARLEIVKPDVHRHHTGEAPLKFCVNLWADCLQLPYSSSFGGGVRTPKIEIEMGSKAHVTEGEGYQAKESTAYQWNKTVKFECSPLDQSAKISLYDEGRFKSNHVATATVMNVRQGNVYWAHLFAGAVYPEDLEVSEEMACGTMRGSTYRGTVVAYFGTAERVSPTFVKTEVEKKLRPTSVIVRIDKGIGFRSFRGKAIKILVQVPGCRLPDAATGKQIRQEARAKEAASQEQSPNAKADEAKKDKKAPVFNYNLISISGKVDDKGCFKADLLGARRTPQEFPVMLMPGVTHAYLYVVGEGEEILPPKIWGTVPLLPYGAQDVLQWQRLDYDQSVYTHKEPLDFETHQAGMLLAGVFLESVHPKLTQAELDGAGHLELPPPVQDILAYEDITDDVLPLPGYFTCCGSYVPKHVGSKGVEFAVAEGPLAVKPKNTMMMYCHIDMLAARQLPAREGLRCGYKISIDDTELVMWRPDLAACTDPQWLHRLILPVEVDAERDTHHEMPLVLVELLDFKDFSEGDDKHTAKGIAILSFRASFFGETSAEDVIDLNTLHCAEWHALKGEQRIPFVEDMHKELVRQDQFVAWKGRPRLLCAAAWSKSKNVKDVAWVKGAGVGGDSVAMWKQVDEGWYTDIKTPAKATFQITIDLLGLRNLPQNATVDRVVINASWASDTSGVSAAMNNTGHDFAGGVECPNFKHEEPQAWFGNALAKTTPDWQVFANSVSDIVKVTNGQGDEVDDTGAVARVSEFVGLRIKVPLYQVPVISYMNVHYPEETAESAAIPHVLLPHIGFNIMESNLIGGSEIHGNVSVSCAKILRSGGGPHQKSFVEELLDSVKQVKPEWRAHGKDHLVKIMDDETGQLLKDPYSVHLDVFAHVDGYLEVNELLRVWEVLWGRGDMGNIKCKQQKEAEDKVNNAGAPGCCKALKRCCRGVPELLFEGEAPHQMRFNPVDNDHSNSQGREGPHQAIPTLVCQDRSKKMPMSCKELFDAFLKHKRHHRFNNIGHLELDHKTLNTAYTSQIIQASMRHGWRCQSHLTAPEPEKSLKGPLNKKDLHFERDMRKCLEHNSHTFVRSIGHIINNLDRDSRIVARLKVSYPEGNRPHASDLEKDKDFEQYIFIKFHCPGIVVWAAPDCVTEWASPGMPLLAVQLNDDNRSVIVVRIPCFDIRFPGEKTWQVSKTIRRRSNGVRKKLQEAVWAKEEAELLAKDPVEAHRHAEQRQASIKKGEIDAFTIFQNDQALTQWKASHLPDGSVAKPIWVHKGGFICRLVKKNSAIFDRLSTKNWYRSMMTPLFPEIGALPEVDCADDPRADVDFVKSYGLCRMMNMFAKFRMADKNSVGGFTDCYLKGHISCKMLKDDEVESATKALLEKPLEEHATCMPWDRFWLTESVEVSVNVLTMHGFTGLENGTLRVVMSAGGQDVEKTISSTGISRLGRQETVNVYSGGLVSCTMPAASTLEISVYEVNGLGISTLLGTSYIDVESRWFVTTMISMKERCDQKYLERAVSPETMTYFAPCDDRSPSVDGSSLLNGTARGTRHCRQPTMPKEVGINEKHTKVKPRYVPSCRAPIEVLPMFKGGQSENAELTGQMRCWIELSDSGGARPVMMPDTLRGTDVQLRIRLHDVTNVQVFADSGRNDLKVQVDLVIETVSGQIIRRTMETEVAKMSTERAEFNTQWVERFKAPVLRCSITYTLMDADKFSSEDWVYDPVTCELDGLFRASHEQGFALGPYDMPITFMEWPQQNKTSHKAWSWTPQTEQPLLHAKLRCDIDIVEDFGAETVYEDGKVFTECYRFSWREGLNQPHATLRLLLGPKHYRNFRIATKCLLPFVCVTLVILITVVAIFYTIQILESYHNIKEN